MSQTINLYPNLTILQQTIKPWNHIPENQFAHVFDRGVDSAEHYIYNQGHSKITPRVSSLAVVPQMSTSQIAPSQPQHTPRSYGVSQGLSNNTESGSKLKQETRGRKRKYHTEEERKAARALQNREAMKKSRQKKRCESIVQDQELEYLRKHCRTMEQHRSEMMDTLERVGVLTREQMNKMWPLEKSHLEKRVQITSIINM